MLRKTKEKFPHIKEKKKVRVFSRGGQIHELNTWRDESLKPMKSEENPIGFRVQQISVPLASQTEKCMAMNRLFFTLGILTPFSKIG